MHGTPAKETDSELMGLIIRLTKGYKLFNYIKMGLRNPIIKFLALKHKDSKKVAEMLGTSRQSVYRYGKGVWSKTCL